ncbi:3',5'-cyclic-nucleotide phosphodiesterase [Xylophilus sp. GOD-11R]|uniref:3',5'-cyclic-nucleotide phosphodiesterase n=1 Tax=Xylophilus sp. GOD-11R TaxID=3089814 RepID=UPI00298CED3E|nr:3',5'-cyclic-nucleotide phosphodiesterase [Xylophilus sp. GOD-11R]WPB56870.1 3',5'-cyclic-nucleotide phosphodiesterase [Xylophilus sp. GOD-11R]
MKVRVLGCSGSIAPGRRTTSFLVDDDLLVDAGTGVGDLSLEEMARIDHVLLSHSHLDHIVALPLMADAVGSLRDRPVQVHALGPTIAALRTHVFNNVIWPNFEQIPSPEKPFVKLIPFHETESMGLAGKRIRVLPAVHTVPAVGFAIDDGGAAWVYSGDTGPNPAFWDLVNAMDVGALVIETAFSESERPLAEISKHLSPGMLGDALLHLSQPGRFPIWITHAKPAERALIASEIAALQLNPNLSIGWLTEGQVIGTGNSDKK